MPGAYALIKIRILEQDLLQISSELIVVSYSYKAMPLKDYIGRLDWLLNGQISHLIKIGKITGRLGEAALLYSTDKIPPKKILILGLGSREDFTSALIQQCCCNLMGIVSDLKLAHISIGAFEKSAKEFEYREMVHDMIHGILAGYVQNFSNDATISVSFAEEDKDKYELLYKAVKLAIENYPGGHGQD